MRPAIGGGLDLAVAGDGILISTFLCTNSHKKWTKIGESSPGHYKSWAKELAMRTDPPPISLSDVLSEIPDSRHQRGKLYPLAAVLTMVATAMLCGARSLGGHRRMGAQIQPPRSVPGPRPQDQGWDTLPHSLHQRTLHRPGYPFGRGV